MSICSANMNSKLKGKEGWSKPGKRGKGRGKRRKKKRLAFISSY
jgi:hypothetical protein